MGEPLPVKPERDAINTMALPPVHTFAHILEAFCHAQRDVPGSVIVRVQFGTWRTDMQLAELYGVLDRLRFTGVER